MGEVLNNTKPDPGRIDAKIKELENSQFTPLYLKFNLDDPKFSHIAPSVRYDFQKRNEGIDDENRRRIDGLRKLEQQKQVYTVPLDPVGYTGKGTSEDPWKIKLSDDGKTPCGKRTYRSPCNSTIQDSIADAKAALDVQILENLDKYAKYPRFMNDEELKKYYCRDNDCVIPTDYFYGLSLYKMDDYM
jgi:hypothetical protein